MEQKFLPSKARDRWVITGISLLVSQLFISIGTGSGWFELIHGKTFIADTIFAFGLTSVLWWYVRSVTGLLQKKYDWLLHPLQRVIRQVGFGLLLPSLVCASLVSLYYHFYYGMPVSSTSFPDYEFPFCVVFIAQFNLYYLLYYLFQKSRATAPTEPPTHPKKILIATLGIKNIPVHTDEVANIFIKDSLVFITTFDGNRLSVNSTLDDIYGTLDTNEFFRANRQVIVHRKSCKSFVSQSSGKLLVEVLPAAKDEVVISQLKAADFKNWIGTR